MYINRCEGTVCSHLNQVFILKPVAYEQASCLIGDVSYQKVGKYFGTVFICRLVQIPFIGNWQMMVSPYLIFLIDPGNTQRAVFFLSVPL